MGTTRATKLLVATAALLVAVAAAQAPAAAPGPETSTGTDVPGPSTVAGGPGPSAGLDCMTYLLNMSDCLTYVEEGSNLTAPDKACCPELAGLVESQPICLCQLLGTNTSASLPVQINMQKALKLPSVCGVQTPPVSLCSGSFVKFFFHRNVFSGSDGSCETVISRGVVESRFKTGGGTQNINDVLIIPNKKQILGSVPKKVLFFKYVLIFRFTRYVIYIIKLNGFC